jgi:hypothetical protein
MGIFFIEIPDTGGFGALRWLSEAEATGASRSHTVIHTFPKITIFNNQKNQS